MTDAAHSASCTCERCWERMTGSSPPPDERLPISHAELLAALDRAFNAGVQAGLQRAAREAQE